MTSGTEMLAGAAGSEGQGRARSSGASRTWKRQGRGRGALWGALDWGTNPMPGGPHPHDPITSQGLHLLTPSHWG